MVKKKLSRPGRNEEMKMNLRVATAMALGVLTFGSLNARADDALDALTAMHKTPPVDWPARADRRGALTLWVAG